jgi:hypothetical protein
MDAGTFKRIAVLVGTFLTFGLFLAAPSSAHWYGFTGDNFWYCSPSPGFFNRCLSDQVHSYWFASAKKNDSGGALRVCAIARNDDAERGLDCATDFVRVCYLQQPYPNCHDEDGFSARAAVYHEGSGQRAIQGHGAY